MTKVFNIETVGNMTMIVSDCGTVYKAMDTETLTEAKLNRAIKSVTKFYKDFKVNDVR